jgi:hypothetical protein
MAKKTVQLNETQIQELKQYAERLVQLQTEIASNDALSVNHAKIALKLVIEAGGILNKMKELLKHGEWEKWATENITCISKSTRVNYMKLAKESAKVQHTGFLTDVNSLRQAYIRVGIINKKPDTKPTVEEPANVELPKAEPAIPPDEKALSPEKMKETDRVQYDERQNQARQQCHMFIRKKFDASKGVNWNLSKWTVKDNKPCSGDAANIGAALLRELQEWVAVREFPTLVSEDEVCAKAGTVLSEVVNAIILANTKHQTPNLLRLMDITAPIPLEANRQTVEVLEVVEPTLGE